MIVNERDSLREAIESVRRARLPTREMRAELDGVLHAAFMDTQARAHVITGRLKASGRESSDRMTDGWHGQIAYGGPGVEQAIYEVARGGAHDPLGGLPAYEEAFEEVIDRGIREAWG